MTPRRLTRARLLALVTPFRWRGALMCTPAMALLVAGGWAMDRLPQAAIAAGGAYAVGFGASRSLGGLRWGAMALALAAMTAGTVVGTVAGEGPAGLLLAAGAAAGCAWLALRHENAWWATLQGVISLFVAEYYPGPLQDGLSRAAAVAAGGGLQIALAAALAHAPGLRGRVSAIVPSTPYTAPGLPTSHALRAALSVTGASLVAQATGFAYRYWAPMTVALVLKPRLHETRARGVERLLGTLAGCAVATVTAVAVHTHPGVLIGLVVAAAGLSYALERAAYPLLASAITATIVLLLALVRGHPLAAAEDRLMATATGGGVALLLAHLFPHRTPRAADPLEAAAADRL